MQKKANTFQKPDICLKYPFLLILCNILIVWDTEFLVVIIFKP